jgi:hypothetical protein
MQSALPYNFQHLLMLTEVSSLPSIMFWKVQEVLTALEYCGDDLIDICTCQVVLWDKYTVWVFE